LAADLCWGQSPAMRFPRLFAAVLILSVTVPGRSESEQLTVLSQSPDAHFQLRRLPADPGEHGEARKTLEIADWEGKTLFQWISPLGASSAIWSQDSRFLAVNDGPGRVGDQVWMFSLDPHAKRVISLREPNGIKLRDELEKRHGSFLHLVGGLTFRALEWRDNRLWCSLNGNFLPRRNKSVQIPFHYLWVLGSADGEGVRCLEEWTRTDPKERAISDKNR